MVVGRRRQGGRRGDSKKHRAVRKKRQDNGPKRPEVNQRHEVHTVERAGVHENVVYIRP